MAQWVKCLLSKREDPNSGPQYPCKKLNMVMCSRNNLSAGKTATGRSVKLVSQSGSHPH